MCCSSEVVVGRRRGVVYLIDVMGWVYVGETVQDLEKRLRDHVYIVFNSEPYSGEGGGLPFVEPYKNFQGLHSKLKKFVSTHRDWEQLKQQSEKIQKQWLLQKLIEHTTVVDSCWCEQRLEVSKKRPKPRVVTGKTELLKKEKNWIRKFWVENPKKLLNYNSRPNHKLFAYQLKEAVEVDALKHGYEYVDDVPESTMSAIRSNRRSAFRTKLAEINKELKLLNAGSVAERQTYLRCLIWKKEAEARADAIYCDF